MQRSVAVKNALFSIFKNDRHYCCLCFSTLDEDTYFCPPDKVFLEEESDLQLKNILNTLGINHTIFSAVMCLKCTESAVNAYKFIKMCKKNLQSLENTVECVQNCIIKENKQADYDTLYISMHFDGDQLFSQQFWDSKSVDHLPGLNRFSHILNNNKRQLCMSTSGKMVDNCLGCAKNKHHVMNKGKLNENVKEMKCSNCNSNFQSRKLLKYHRRKCGKSFLCSECGKSFSKKSVADIHEASHKLTYTCHLCGKLYKTKKSFNIHLKLCNQRGNTVDKPTYQCDYCNKNYFQKSSLSSHIQVEHLNDNRFVCSWCNKKFSALSLLKRHIVTHTHEQKFSCDLCGKKFASKYALQCHSKTHTGEKPYPCDYCEKKFATTSRKHAHMTRLHAESAYECELCHSKFKTVEYMRKHKKRHVKSSSRLYMAEEKSVGRYMMT